MGESLNYSIKYSKRAEVLRLFIRLVRPVKRNWHLVEGYRGMRLSSPVRVWYDKRSTILDLLIDLPATKKPVRYLIYVSAQESRPLSPAQVVSKINRVLKRYRAYSIPMDTAKYMICPRGYTSYTIKMLKAHGIIPSKNDKQVLENIAKYFRNRYNRLIDALKGKRVYGELVLFLYILREIIKSLGYTLVHDPLEEPLKYCPSPLYIAEQGIIIN